MNTVSLRKCSTRELLAMREQASLNQDDTLVDAIDDIFSERITPTKSPSFFAIVHIGKPGISRPRTFYRSRSRALAAADKLATDRGILCVHVVACPTRKAAETANFFGAWPVIYDPSKATA